MLNSAPTRGLLLALLLCALLVSACRRASDDDGETPTATNENTTTTAPIDDDAGTTRHDDNDGAVVIAPGQPPRAVGTWPDGYAAQLRSDTLMAVLVQPSTLATELDRALETLAQVDETGAARVRETLTTGLGDLVELLDPASWESHGLDASRAVLVQLTVGEGTGVDEAAQRVDALLAAGADTLDTDAHDAVRRAAIGLRVALPANDLDAAVEFVRGAIPTIEDSAVNDDVIDGYDSVFTVRGRALVGLTSGEGVLIIDTVLTPFLPETDPVASLELQRRTLEALGRAPSTPPDAPGLPGPGPEPWQAFVSVDLARLGRLDAVGELASMDAPGKIPPARIAAARIDRQLLVEGDYRALAAEVSPDGALSVSALFTRHRPELYEALGEQPAVNLTDGMVGIGIAPPIAAARGPWAEAGLAPVDDLDVGDLLLVLGEGHGVLPMLVPVWMSVLPGLIWRDLVPTPARYLEPGTIERAEVVVGDGFTLEAPEVALMVVDRDGDLDLHRHGLACLSQRRPVQGRCRDERIELGKRAQVRFGSGELHYLLESREIEGQPAVVLVASTTEALRDALASAPVASSARLGHVGVDLERLSRSRLGEALSGPVAVLARLLGRFDAEAVLDADGLHWRAQFARPISLAGLAGIAGPALLEYVRHNRELEAFVNLESLAVAAVAHHDGAGGGKYPIVADAVCTEGASPDGQRILSDEATWQAAPWKALQWQIALPHLYRYCYRSAPDGSAFAVLAEANLDPSDDAATGDPIDSRFCVRSESDASGAAVVARVEPVDSAAACQPTP